MSVGFARAEKLGTAVAALAILAFAVFVAGTGPARAGEATQVRLFGSGENANADISPFPNWTGALNRYAGEQHLEDAPCTGGRCALQEWKAFVVSLKGQDRMRQLEAVNAYVNRVPWQADDARYGMVDYWATPREFFGRTGDCEDYVIAKYLSLRKLGWPAAALRIVVLKHELRNELHAVLVAYLNGTAYVLDNLAAGVREHAAIGYYRPIFSINETAWHYHRDWRPATATMLARTEPERPHDVHVAGGQARPEPGTRIAGTQIPGAAAPAIDTTRPAAWPATPLRYDYAPARVPSVARSYAGRAGESLAALFSNSGGPR
jgi:predicted transglutaminase-like cysteine proteinase